MTEKEAKNIGAKQGLIAGGIGLVIAQFIMTAFISIDKNLYQAFFWFTTIEYKLNIFIGAIIMLYCGHIFGQIAGKQIIIKQRNFMLVGLSCGLAVLLTTAFLSGWTGFFREGIHNSGTQGKPFNDYILKPLFWVAIFGVIPASMVGLWLGWQIKRKAQKHF